MRTIASGASALRESAALLRRLYLSYGYEEVLTPSCEPWDELRPALGARAQKDSLKLIGDDGEVLVLRPEVTAGLLRRALREIPKGAIRRYFYCQKIHRRGASLTGRTEFWQAGGEILGGGGVLYDAEAIDLLGKSLALLKVPEYTLEIGDAGLLGELVEDAALRGEFKTALARHDGSAARALAERAPAPMRPLLRELPFLRGEAGVLDQARKLAPRPLQALDRLRELAQALAARGALEHLMFDLALSGWADYYDGPLVEVYVEGRADAVGAGGRYDGLTTLYGKPLPVCGAALMLDPLLEGAMPAERIPAVLVIGDDDAAARRAAGLRADGKTVIQIAALLPDTLDDLKLSYELTAPAGRPC